MYIAQPASDLDVVADAASRAGNQPIDRSLIALQPIDELRSRIPLWPPTAAICTATSPEHYTAWVSALEPIRGMSQRVNALLTGITVADLTVTELGTEMAMIDLARQASGARAVYELVAMRSGMASGLNLAPFPGVVPRLSDSLALYEDATATITLRAFSRSDRVWCRLVMGYMDELMRDIPQSVAGKLAIIATGLVVMHYEVRAAVMGSGPLEKQTASKVAKIAKLRRAAWSPVPAPTTDLRTLASAVVAAFPPDALASLCSTAELRNKYWSCNMHHSLARVEAMSATASGLLSAVANMNL